jgi:hypothetical protein
VDIWPITWIIDYVIIKTVSPLNTSNEIKRSFTIAFRLIIIKSTYYFF